MSDDPTIAPQDNPLLQPPALEETANGEKNLAEEEKKKKKDAKKEWQQRLLLIYRASSRNHINISAIADRRANFILSVSVVLASLVIAFLAQQVQQQPYFALPGLLLILVCVFTIVFAVLSTTPVLSRGYYTPEQLKARKANPLFFGNYYKMEPAEYELSIDELLRDREFLKKAISYDLFHLGKAVARKFRFLRISYIIFLIGIVLSLVLAYFSFKYQLVWFTDVFYQEKM